MVILFPRGIRARNNTLNSRLVGMEARSLRLVRRGMPMAYADVEIRVRERAIRKEADGRVSRRFQPKINKEVCYDQ